MTHRWVIVLALLAVPACDKDDGGDAGARDADAVPQDIEPVTGTIDGLPTTFKYARAFVSQEFEGDGYKDENIVINDKALSIVLVDNAEAAQCIGGLPSDAVPIGQRALYVAMSVPRAVGAYQLADASGNGCDASFNGSTRTAENSSESEGWIAKGKAVVSVLDGEHVEGDVELTGERGSSLRGKFRAVLCQRRFVERRHIQRELPCAAAPSGGG